MNILLVFVIAIGIWKIHVNKEKAGFLDKEQTTAINGFFVLIVFVNHFSQYIELKETDYFFKAFYAVIGQLMVTPFLFFSGYGVMASFITKGEKYVKKFWKSRIIRIWIHFAIVVLLYDIMNLLIGIKYSYHDILLAFTGWTSVGNSNWYVFVILLLYLFSWISFRLFATSKWRSVLLTSVLCVFMICILKLCKEVYWYNTVMVYPFGMLIAMQRAKIQEKLGNKKILLYLFGVTILLGICAIIVVTGVNISSAWFQIYSILFMICICLFTMIVRINNPILAFLGKYTFEIYILQRIPMILLKEHIQNMYVYFLSAFISTLVLAIITRKCFAFIDKKWFD